MKPNTMKWLLRREFWEYKGAMFWAPTIVALLLVLLTGGTAAYGIAGHHIPSHVTIQGHTMQNGGAEFAYSLEMKTIFAKVASSMYLGASVPLFLILAGVVFSYCLGALYDERRDRSILFWKSLPLSDTTTVLSKVATALVVAPLITAGIALVASLALLFIICAALGMQGMNMFGAVLASPDLYLAPLRLLALLPVYIVWALPTVGWLMLVSSWARTKPLLWAVGTPIVALLLVRWIDAALRYFSGQQLDIVQFASDTAARLLSGVVPGIWFVYHNAPALRPTEMGVDTADVVAKSYMSLLGPDAWIGVAMGVAMLYAAVRMRRWRDEG